MNKEDCVIGQRVILKPHFQYNMRFDGLIGTIKELPLGFVVVELDIPFLASELKPPKLIVQDFQVEEVSHDPPD